ncbi:MAG: Holliday junction resolvase RuvX [Acidimicrobiales bacterium]
MKALGLDLGASRIGVAVSDSRGVLALPRHTIRRGRERGEDHAAVAAAVAETGAEVVVVGLPLSLDGRRKAAARAVLEEVGELRAVLAVAVETEDERLSTVTASRALAAAGRSVRGQRPVVDQTAAAVVLQAWLDRRARARRTG